MKRSEINKALKDLENMLREYQYFLPKFADFTPEEWKSKGHEFDEIRDNMLGWDITDYGLEDFHCLRSVTEILRCRINIKNHTQKNFSI